MNLLKRTLAEVLFFFGPALRATESAQELTTFFHQFGYELRGTSLDLNAAKTELQAFTATAGLDTFDDVADDTRTSETLEDALALVEQVVVLLQLFDHSASLQAVLDDADDLALEILDFLVAHYLATRHPLVASSLRALGILVRTPVAASDTGGRDVDYVAVTLRWDRLRLLFEDTGAWADDVYGWGADFDHARAIDALVGLVEATRLALARRREMTPAEVALFVTNAAGGTFVEAALPFVQNGFTHVDAAGDPVFAQEAGVKVVPFGNAATPSAMGLAFAPYATGTAAVDAQISDRISLRVLLDAAATGGAYLTVTPSGLGVGGGGVVDASFEFALRYAHEDEMLGVETPLVLVGSADGTRVEIVAAHLSVGGNLSGDFFLAGGVEGLGIAIDLSGDGFLGEVLDGPIVVEAGDFLVGWRSGRGVYFEGGTSLGVIVPLDLDFGPFGVQEVGLFLDWETAFSIAVTVSADLSVGPLYAYVEGLGLRATLVEAPAGDGQLGRYDLRFSVVPPSGYAVSLDSDVITGGGLISIRDHQYRGALALRLESFGLSAFAILDTQLPGGKEGFSFIASIFTEFEIALGFGFFLTGLGGIIGLHRTIDSQALRDVLYEGRADNLLFPADPIGNAETILDDMAAIFPPREGQHVFGPVAKIGWGQPILIEGKLGLVIEVGEEVRLLILGGISCALPEPDDALIELNLTFFGEIDFAAGTVSFDATLQNSRILAWALSGDMAMRTGWGDDIQHVVSFGGLHPRYPKPSNLPDLRRMSLSFGSNNPRITLSSYLAITHNSLQFGARADLYVRGPDIWLVGQLAAEGNVYFDALIYFNPFEFEADLGGSLSLLVDGEVVLGLGFRLRFSGPNPYFISGTVWATIFGIDIDFGVSHTWGTPRPIPPPIADAPTVLREALTGTRGFEPITIGNRTSGVSFDAAATDDTDGAVDPLGGLRLVQRAVPLGVEIDKIGEALLVGARTVDIALYDGSNEVDADQAELDFVRGHYWSLDENARLRAPSFELHKAGLEIVGGADFVFDPAEVIEETYEYEIIKIGTEEQPTSPPAIVDVSLNEALADRWFQIERHDLGAAWVPVEPPRADDALSMVETRYVNQSQVARAVDVGRTSTTSSPRAAPRRATSRWSPPTRSPASTIPSSLTTWPAGSWPPDELPEEPM